MRSRIFVFIALFFASGCGGTGTSVVPQPVSHGALAAAQGVHGRYPFVYSAHPQAHFAGNLNFSNCAVAPATLLCAVPSTIRRVYNFPDSLKGTGETIMIVDAFGSPTLQSDVAAFDADVGLPAPPSLTVYKPDGGPPFKPNDPDIVNWAIETDLDVEWAHAAAPGANIAVIVASSDGNEQIENAEEYAISRHFGNVLSLSFGIPETLIKHPTSNDDFLEGVTLLAKARASSITVVASAGDKGAGNGSATATAQFPASDPDVLGVGGTSLILSATGGYQSESVWNDANNCLAPCILGADGATGGAPSIIFPVPAYQAPVVNSTMRTTADVAYNASPNSGVVIWLGFASLVPGLGPNGEYAVGGTSQGTPQWAGIVAIVNQQQNHVPLGFFNDKLYTIGTNNATLPLPPLHDIISGNNTFPGNSSPGFSAATGYDYPTGWGTPSVSNLVTAITGRPPPCSDACPTPTPSPGVDSP